MKNFIKYLGFTAFAFIVMLVMLVMPVWSFAQEVGESVKATGLDPSTWFATLVSLVGAVMAITQFLKTKVIGTKGFSTMILSWVVSVVVSGVGWWLQLGIFAGLDWYWGLIYALSAGLVANGIASTAVVDAILSFVPKKSR